ncbi:hypothetical protein [Paraburkholderia bannensis]|uniref:hypothetical protein n=1 Tax=Paraburkholderia bannensis TaxID=765414 RepID=UPI002AB77242|nr:hypothetical protein [Paraburkholderia bannensis]
MKVTLTMEITVPQLQYPLLFERLSSCPSPRERAAIFKALAETQLRGDLLESAHGLSTRLGTQSPDDVHARLQTGSTNWAPGVVATASVYEKALTLRDPGNAPTEEESSVVVVRVDDSVPIDDVVGSYLDGQAFI